MLSVNYQIQIFSTWWFNNKPSYKMIRYGLFLAVFLGNTSFAKEEALNTLEQLSSLQGAKIEFELEQLPSGLWPTFIQLQDSHSLAKKVGTRGTLLRIESDQLLVDFGRHGIIKVDPHQTNFFDELMAHIKNQKVKEFPNLALQIGNKLMRFDQGEESGAIRFEKIETKLLYILLYLDRYSPDQAQDLLDFGMVYSRLEKCYPNLIVILMPNDRTYYDFGATTSYSVPMIAPHMRRGYIDSLAHNIVTYPTLVACDANGKILARSDSTMTLKNLPSALESLLQLIGIDWISAVGKTNKKAEDK